MYFYSYRFVIGLHPDVNYLRMYLTNVFVSYVVFRISATSQLDRRDSLGVCVDSPKGAESLQRDQAVCISTNGTPTQTTSFLLSLLTFFQLLVAAADLKQAPSPP